MDLSRRALALASIPRTIGCSLSAADSNSRRMLVTRRLALSLPAHAAKSQTRRKMQFAGKDDLFLISESIRVTSLGLHVCMHSSGFWGVRKELGLQGALWLPHVRADVFP